ncbi:MAG: helix-turn-helix transcriptional regulator [Angelakisella sp.]|jgi:transcriptional regulator with XRE-family HTH domain|nr:helix-turn-helix transcriptional regulator [Angelakisella sp.]MCI9528449.1 helix-turn-helix transcriptional regulator [Angelakisella sp.]
MVNSEFPRILTLLRKEKGVSQKTAAASLQVSQALLSHYEKGIRECGLSFLVRAADYYGVSCDYMLGRTPDRTGTTLSIDEIPEADAAGKENLFRGGILTVLNKKLIANSLNILFDKLNRAGSTDLVKEVSDYLMVAVYQMFRLVYGANKGNQAAIFKLPETIAHPYASAAMEMHWANASAIAQDKPAAGMDRIQHPEELEMSTESITDDYPLFGTSLLNLVSNAEKAIGLPGKQD